MKHAAHKSFFLTLLVSLNSLTWAGDFKAQEPSPAEATRLIKMAQSQKTNDGSTVLELLHYAEKMRPKIFKSAEFDFGYRWDGSLWSPNGNIYFLKHPLASEISVDCGADSLGPLINLDLDRVPFPREPAFLLAARLGVLLTGLK